ncbi:hypothetical protein [Halomonas litopenaei]|uniref:hypothetical protein n=1 Tax=Halomonas litopenaei TaxID=2109328 RepID=UPI001A903031|nr:hypothetical protein [Halomonas litopenaei]MBN8411126.1 hypothetical protein [Halomonas litopenaei]
MVWSSFISGVAGGFFGSGAVWLLLKIYLAHRLELARSKIAEERLKLQKQREASTAVAEILSTWIKSNYQEGTTNDEQRWEIQTTYWKNILLLDKRLIDQLFPLLALRDGAITTNEMVVRARQILLGLEEPDIKADALNNWPPVKSAPASG